MADAWTNLRLHSSLIGSGHDAWEHLLAQDGSGGGEIRYVAKNGLVFSMTPAGLKFITTPDLLQFKAKASKLDFSVTEAPTIFQLKNVKYTFVLTKVTC